MNSDELLKLLGEKNYTLSTMESLTGGLFASTIVSIPGASKVFKGGIVAYTNDAKLKLGIKEETLNNYGAVSAECVKEMALLASTLFESDVSIAFTGNAGPETQDGKSVGKVFIGLRIKDKLHCFEVQLKGDRDKIRKECVDLGLQILLDKIK